jgi:hypothetical protein
MRTVILIVAGFVGLGVFALVAWRMGGNVQAIPGAAKVFIPVWLLAALANMWMGVARAGYSVAEEFPIFLVIFSIPAAASGFLWWRYS